MQQATGFPGVRRRVREAAQTQARIIGAVIMRDMRTRFGRSYLSFGLALAWPLVHIMVIFTAFVAMSRVVPMGASAGRFIATGAMPYILVLYPARMMTLAVLQNHQTLMFPIVKTTDLIIARAIVEFFSAFIVVICFAMIMTALDVDIVPLDWIQAAAAILAAIYLGIGLGVMNVIMMTLARLWIVVFIGAMALLYVSAGVSTMQLGFSATTREILSYNPIAHAVVWLRTAYYGDFSEIELSRGYLLGIATVALFLGVIGDRLLRGRVLLT